MDVNDNDIATQEQFSICTIATPVRPCTRNIPYIPHITPLTRVHALRGIRPSWAKKDPGTKRGGKVTGIILSDIGVGHTNHLGKGGSAFYNAYHLRLTGFAKVPVDFDNNQKMDQ